MCIRDRLIEDQGKLQDKLDHMDAWNLDSRLELAMDALRCPCLLYTSDAADERSSVDLGGRRIIKKKSEEKHSWERCISEYSE